MIVFISIERVEKLCEAGLSTGSGQKFVVVKYNVCCQVVEYNL